MRVAAREPTSRLLILLVILLAPPARGEPIFFDDFETGDVKAWSSSTNVDCDSVMSEVPDCDLELGLGSWAAIPDTAITFIADDDSDGEMSSGAIELVAGIDGAEMGLCFAKTISGSAVFSRQVDARLVSGTLAQGFCFAGFGVYSNSNCTGEQIDFGITAFAPDHGWSGHLAGTTSVPSRARSFLLQIGCTGDGGPAVVRFDDLVVTTLPIERP